jgi:hypothetical protein
LVGADHPRITWREVRCPTESIDSCVAVEVTQADRLAPDGGAESGGVLLVFVTFSSLMNVVHISDVGEVTVQKYERRACTEIERRRF